MREQKELEKSLANLKLSLPELNLGDSGSERGSDDRLIEGRSRKIPSVKSDFSLSVFPEPPWTPPARREFHSHLKAETDVSDLLPPRMPAAMSDVGDRQSLPTSTRTSEDTIRMGRAAQLGSNGAQFDVTSFISGTLGGLAAICIIVADMPYRSYNPDRIRTSARGFVFVETWRYHFVRVENCDTIYS